MSRAIRALVDGMPSDVIAIDDRGLQYGHGMFETCRVVGGTIPLWRYHRDRLGATASHLQIPLDLHPLDVEVAELAATQSSGVVKVIVTAGRASTGYRSAKGPPRRVIVLFPPRVESVGDRHGVTVRICRMRLSAQPALAGLKHLNRLEQVLARAEWSEPEIAEGLLCDIQGHLIEGTATNVFLVKAGRIVTPSLDRCGVAGVLRRVLLEERPGIDAPIEIRDVGLAELADADECFLTNAVVGVWPVARIVGLAGARPRTSRITAQISTALEARYGFGRSL